MNLNPKGGEPVNIYICKNSNVNINIELFWGDLNILDYNEGFSHCHDGESIFKWLVLTHIRGGQASHLPLNLSNIGYLNTSYNT